MPTQTPENQYTQLVESFAGDESVSHDAPGKKTFGAEALKMNGKIFAMLVRGQLVVKLPRQRVEALIASGDGERFDTGNGRLMKEWLVLSNSSSLDWQTLAREAKQFVAAKS